MFIFHINSAFTFSNTRAKASSLRDNNNITRLAAHIRCSERFMESLHTSAQTICQNQRLRSANALHIHKHGETPSAWQKDGARFHSIEEIFLFSFLVLPFKMPQFRFNIATSHCIKNVFYLWLR